MRAQCEIRRQLHYRREIFCAGLEAGGYTLVEHIADPRPDDVYVCWNRYGRFDQQAARFERCGARVVIAENGYLRNVLPGKWFTLSLHDHAGLGSWPVGDSQRWDSFGVQLSPWQKDGDEIIIFEQRCIGSPQAKSPPNWAQQVQRKIRNSRIRGHPGDGEPAISLFDDLAQAHCAITWGSSAGLAALVYGVPIFHQLKNWIGAQASLPFASYPREPKHDSEARLSMFRRLAWCTWRGEEIQSGFAFRHLLQNGR